MQDDSLHCCQEKKRFFGVLFVGFHLGKVLNQTTDVSDTHGIFLKQGRQILANMRSQLVKPSCKWSMG